MNKLIYDKDEFLDAISTLREYIRTNLPDHEVGIVVTIDNVGIWHSSDIVEGDYESVEYDFSDYYSQDPDINPEEQFPQGTVHYHPYVDTELNYLPSSNDLFNSANLARTVGDWFVCGVVNHRLRATLTFVNKSAYAYMREQWMDIINSVFDAQDRRVILQLHDIVIDDLIREGHIIVEEIEESVIQDGKDTKSICEVGGWQGADC